MSDDASTTVAILTPTGRGAVAVISVIGPSAIQYVEQFFQPKVPPQFSDRPLGRIVYGRWGNEPAEDVIACRLAQSQVEVHCHGGSAAAQRIVDDLTSAGAKRQTWTDWIDRHETSPLRAAARTALAHAVTQRTAAILLDQYHGSLESSLRQTLAHLDASDPQAAAAELTQLLSLAPLGLHLTQPWRVVIAGPPNVGKSSLLNAFLGYRRAIVFDQPGTTRDVVTATTALNGWPVQMSDTAGWRTSGDPLEAAGAHLAEQQAKAADCLLLVFDASQPWSDAHQHLVDMWPQAIVVGNKCDLPRNPSHPATLFTSALKGEGIELLLEKIAAQLVPFDLPQGAAVPFCQSHVEQLRRASNALAQKNNSAARTILLAMLVEKK
jgi:tRNA modification GTPase